MYDSLLDQHLQLPKSSSKYLSHLIQNQLILVLADEVLRDIKRTTKRSFFMPFFLIQFKRSKKMSS